jgi:hypothetical protein
LPRNNKLWRARSLGLSAVLAAVVVSAIAASHGCTTTNSLTTQVDFYGPSGLTVAPAKDRDLLFIASTGGDDLRAISICNTPAPDGGTAANNTCTDLEDFHFLPGPIRLFPGSFPVGNRPVRLASVNLRDADGGVVGGVLVVGVAAQVSVDGGISATADAGTREALPALMLVDSVNVLAATRREATIKVPIAIPLDAPPIDVVSTDVPTGAPPLAGVPQLAFVLTEANVASGVRAELSEIALTPTLDGPAAQVTARCSLSITATRLALIPRTFHKETGVTDPPSSLIYVGDGTVEGAVAGGLGDGALEIDTTTIPPVTSTVAPCTIKRRLVATDPRTGKPRGLASLALSPAYNTATPDARSYPAGAMLLGASTDGLVVFIRTDTGVLYPIPPFIAYHDDAGAPNTVAPVSSGETAYVDGDGGVSVLHADGSLELLAGVYAQPMEPLRVNGLAREVAFFKTPLTCNSQNVVTGQPCELISVGASQSSYLSVAFPLVATVTSTDGTVVFIDADDRRFVSDTRDATAGSTGFQASVNSAYTFAPAQPLSRSAPVLAFAPADTTSTKCNVGPGTTAPVTCKPLGSSQAGVARQSTWRAIWHAQLPGLERQGGTLTRDASGALRFTVPGIDLSRWTDPALPDALVVGDALAVAAFTAAPNGGPLCAFLTNENLTPLAREYTITAIGSNYFLLDDQNTLESGTAAHDATPAECLTGGVGAVVEVRTAGTNPWLILQGNLIHGRAKNGTQFTATETRFDYPLQYVLYPDQDATNSILLPTIANDIAVSFTITGNDPVTPQSAFTWSIGSGQSPTRVSDTGSSGGFAGAVITYTSLKVPGNLVFFSSTGSNTVIQIDPQLLGVLNGVISYR